MIFVDTGAWFAALVPWDANYQRAAAWYGQNQTNLLTTDYVVDETLTLLRSRGEGPKALTIARAFFSGRLATLHFVSEDELRDAFNIFTRYADKDWSFTDCTSKVVIERLGITSAFAFDQHFRQFGGINVVP